MLKRNCKKYTVCILFWMLLSSLHINAQIEVRGVVKDYWTHEPLPFVAVVVKGTRYGCVTDLDGKFSIMLKSTKDTLVLSLLGYTSLEVVKDYKAEAKYNLGDVLLSPYTYQLNEATIHPGINPADAIIRKVISKRDSLNPENLLSYKYSTYNKTIFTAKKDTVVNPLTGLFGTPDTMSKAVEAIFNRQHLFINESVTEKKYKRPGNLHETILASRTSGLKDPIFSTLTTQLQSISFYENSGFKILSTEYNNPLSDDAFSNYVYNIEDTTFSGTDTVFVISFQPKMGRKAKGMNGMLYINRTYYALERASASPQTQNQLQLEVQQIYQRYEDGHWFPNQLNIDMLLTGLKVSNHNMIVEARTYIRDVKINPDLKTSEFGAIEVEVDENAVKDQEKILPLFRQNELDKKDSATYTSIDSLSKQMKLEKRIEFVEALLEGKIRVSILDIPIDRVLGFNNYEGFRLGVGLETNHRMLKWMRLGGYVAYGFTDNALKYGGFVEFLPYEKLEMKIRFDYKRDVFSSANTDFPTMGPIVLTNATNQLVLNIFDSIQLFEGSFSIKPFKNWQLRFAMNHQQMDPTKPYRFLPDTMSNQHYNLTEIELTSRWGIKEKYIAFGRKFIAKPTKFPIIHLHITQSLPGLGGQFSYTKLMGRVTQTFYIKKLGRASFILEGGYVFGDAPYAKLFANRGTFSNFSIVSRNGFETMRSNEFLMDSYISLLFNHNFGTLFRVKKFMRPELSIVHNIGFGWLSNPTRHAGIPFKTMQHGFFEGGIVIDNILVLSNMGLGFGTFYRYGSTASGDPLKNLFFKAAISVAL